jgi:hypothetical protein
MAITPEHLRKAARAIGYRPRREKMAEPFAGDRRRRSSTGQAIEKDWWRTQALSNPSPHRYSLQTGKRTGNFSNLRR